MTAPAPGDLTSLERVIGRVLRVGVLTSSTCLAAGLTLTLLGRGRGLSGWLLWCGLVTLMATPCARVAVSVAEYARERDWLFLSLTLAVLASLAGSVVVALWH